MESMQASLETEQRNKAPGRVPHNQEEAGGRHQWAEDRSGPRQQGQLRGPEVHQALPGPGTHKTFTILNYKQLFFVLAYVFFFIRF